MGAAFVFLWLVWAFTGFLVGRYNGRPLTGFVLSLIAGPFGWVTVALLPPSVAEEVRRDADEKIIQEKLSDAEPEVKEILKEAERKVTA